MNAIEIRNLCKSYGGFAIDNLNLTLPSGCVMGLIGENGAGKSTTIKLILDMVKKDSGTVTILGKDNQDDFTITKEDIGVVLDEVGFSDWFKARDINKIMKCAYKNWDEALFYDYLKRLGVPTDKKFKEFSRGMKMKLGISVALAHRPKLLILDEATNGLDPVVRDEVMDIFNDFTRDEEHSILFSSHIVSDLEKICDYVAFIHKGRLLLCEEKDALKEKYAIVHCTSEELHSVNQSAIIGKKETKYGAEAIALKSEIPEGFAASPIDIEQLFVFMVKGAEK